MIHVKSDIDDRGFKLTDGQNLMIRQSPILHIDTFLLLNCTIWCWPFRYQGSLSAYITQFSYLGLGGTMEPFCHMSYTSLCPHQILIFSGVCMTCGPHWDLRPDHFLNHLIPLAS